MAIIKTFKPTLPDLDKIKDADTFFGKVKEEYPDFWKQGYFKTLDEEVMVIYRVKNTRGSFVGLIACTDVEEYLKGNIVRHELTLAEKERKMMALVKVRQAMIKPTMLTYWEVEEITATLFEYIEKYPIHHQIHFEGEIHDFFLINKKKHISTLINLLKKHLPKTYIADGHHRFATAANLYKVDEARRYQLTALFGSDQLDINEFNRIVETLNHYSTKDFKAELRKYFIIKKLEAPRKPQTSQEIVMHLNKKWYTMHLKDSEKAKLKNLPLSQQLDVSILNRYVLQHILEIKDVRSDTRVKYVEGTKGLQEVQRKVGNSQHKVGFVMYPINGKEYIGVSDAGETLPPKSTFFTPRMRNGFVVHRFE